MNATDRDYIKSLEDENEELRSLLAKEQYNLKGVARLEWTNWCMRYNKKNEFLYYQTVLCSYGGNFAFARICSNLENPNECEIFTSIVHNWSGDICKIIENVSFNLLKIRVEESVKEQLFAKKEIKVNE